MGKITAEGAATTAAVALTAAAVTYFLTKNVYEKKIVTQRSEAYQKDRAEAETIKAARKEAKLPVGKKLE
jgi:hypothetical protein